MCWGLSADPGVASETEKHQTLLSLRWVGGGGGRGRWVGGKNTL